MLTIWMKWFGPTAPTVSAGATPLIFEIPAKFGLAVENSGGVTPKAPTGAPAPSRNSSSGIPFGGGIGTTMSSGRGTPSPMGAKRVADGGVGPTSGRVARSRVKTLGVKGPPTVTSVIPGAGPCARAGFGGPSRQKRSASEINADTDRKSTRLNSSHSQISYAVFCLKKKNNKARERRPASTYQPLPAHAS